MPTSRLHGSGWVGDTQYQRLAYALQDVSEVRTPSRDALIACLHSETRYFYITADSNTEYRTYCITSTGDTDGTLEWVESGTPYQIFKSIFQHEGKNPRMAERIRRLMADAHSPLDTLFANKGATGPDVAPLIRGMNGQQIGEIRDFIDGLDALTRQSGVARPEGVQTDYMRPVAQEEYDDVEEVDNEAYDAEFGRTSAEEDADVEVEVQEDIQNDALADVAEAEKAQDSDDDSGDVVYETEYGKKSDTWAPEDASGRVHDPDAPKMKDPYGPGGDKYVPKTEPGLAGRLLATLFRKK